jgi:hypothetical protein
LVGYTLWVLRRARELGIQRLYFVSRDGQILLRIAEKLAPRLGLSCRLSYLYGSRQAWHLSALTDIGPEQLAWITDATDFLSVKSLLARFGVKPAELREHLATVGLRERDWARNLDPAERRQAGRMFELAPVRQLIKCRAAEHRSRLLGYLDQEGVLTASRYGVVDLGWHGRLQDSLSRVVTGAGGTTPHGFYFGLLRNTAAEELGPREAYFFDRERGTGFVGLGRRLISLLEAFCSADHGLVTDYHVRAGTWGPVMRDTRTACLREWGVDTLQRTVLAFADHLKITGVHVDPWLDVRPALAEVLRAFWFTPAKRDARAWGSFPIEDDQGGSCWAALAPRYRWRDLVPALRSGEFPSLGRGTWVKGCFVLTPAPLRLALRVAVRAGRLGRAVQAQLGRVVQGLLERASLKNFRANESRKVFPDVADVSLAAGAPAVVLSGEPNHVC